MRQETGDFLMGGCMTKCPVSWENLMSQEKISCLFSFGPHPHEKISCLLSHEKISCPKRKSHVIQFWVTHPTRKSPVSCLMRKSHVSRENLMTYQFGAPSQWDNLLFLVSWENPMSQEKISCVTGISHILSFLVPPQRENLLSPVSWENLMTQEKILCLFSIGSPPMRKSPVSCLMRKSRVPRENLMSFQFWPPPMRKSPVSCLMRKSHEWLVLGSPPNMKISYLVSHDKISWPKRKSYVFSV